MLDAVVARQACADGFHCATSDVSSCRASGGVVEVERVASRDGGDGVDDLDVAGAAADVAAERLRDRLAVVACRRASTYACAAIIMPDVQNPHWAA